MGRVRMALALPSMGRIANDGLLSASWRSSRKTERTCGADGKRDGIGAATYSWRSAVIAISDGRRRMGRVTYTLRHRSTYIDIRSGIYTETRVTYTQRYIGADADIGTDTGTDTGTCAHSDT